MTPLEISEIARRQLADYDARHPGGVFEDPLFHLSVDDAYQIQREVVGLRMARGESIAGYKTGCLSTAVQRQFGLDRPVYGHVFATEVHRSGVVLDPARFDCLAIEGEFGLRIAEEIPSVAWLRENEREAIGSVFAVIELHHHVFRGPKPSAQELIANNGLQAGIVLPSAEDRSRDAAELEREPLAVFCNGKLLGEATGQAIPGGPLASLYRLVEHLAFWQVTLKPGQVVLTGSPLKLFPAAPGDRFAVRCARLAEVELSVSK